jgi:GAF domain-containing protein
MSEIDVLLSRYLSVRPASMAQNVLRLLVHTGVAAIGADEGSLLVYDREANDLRFVITTGGKGAADHLVGDRVPLGQGVTGLAAATREVHIGAPAYRDLEKMERIRMGGLDPEAVIAAPMVLDAELLGVLTAVSARTGMRFTGDHARIYGSIATIAAMVVDQERRLGQYESETTGLWDGIRSAGQLEGQIAMSIGRIARDRPHLLGHVATIVSAVEKLAFEE